MLFFFSSRRRHTSSLCDWSSDVCSSDLLFDFGDERGADYSSIGEAAENGNVTGERNAKTHSERKLCDRAGATQERGKVVGERVLRAGDAGAGNEIEKTRRAGGDLREALVSGCGCSKKNRAEMMSAKNTAVVRRFFRREVGRQNTIRACGFSRRSKFLKAHLQDGVVIAEQNQRDFRRQANAADQIEDAGESRS